jgi:hypothetical protein
MSSTSFEPKRRAFANLTLIVPLVLVALLVIGWSIYWYLASKRAEAALAAWTAREAQAGRAWVCPDPKLGGYPLTVEISCSNAYFQGPLVGNSKLTGVLAHFRAATQLIEPTLLVAELDPPFTAKSSDGKLDIVVQWAKMTFETEGTPEALARVALVGHDVSARGTIGDLESTTVDIGRFNTYAVRMPERADRAYKFMLGVNNLSVPSLERLVDAAARTGFSFEGTITRADFGGMAPIQDQIESWRTANGHIDVKAARFTSGTRKFEAQGGLDLDDEHRVRGQLDAEIADFDVILQQVGVDPVILSAGAALADLLGNRSRGDGTSHGLSRLHVPLMISDGYLSVGPVRTSIQFPPLY